jgi:hypothetical protein
MISKGDQRNQPISPLANGQSVFVGRESEARHLEAAILRRESLVICGPAGIGKTALVSNIIHRLPVDLGARCLYLGGMKNLQDLLRQLIRRLYKVKDTNLRQRLHSEKVSVLNFDAWLNGLSSSRMRGTLYFAAERGDYRVFPDHLPPLTHAVAKVIKELFWMRNTPVYLLVRDRVEHRIDQFNRFFYWGDRERLALRPLPPEAAIKLLERCIERFGLSQLDLADFREEVLELSKQVPGAIVKMCALAAEPRYRYGLRIKTKTVYVDYLMSGHNLSLPGAKLSGT